MSKSKGNVIDPLDVIDQYGADALRMTLAAMAAQGRDIKLSVQRVEGYRNFATKIWNAARFAEMNGCKRVAGFDPQGVKETLNKWALGECAKAVDEVTAGIEAYKFNEAALAAYRFVWNVFCDWTLELAKPVLQGADSPAKVETQRDDRLHLRRDQQAAAPLHAVHHRGAVGDQGRGGAEARDDPGARALAATRCARSIRRRRPRSAGWSTSSTKSAPRARRRTCRPARRSRSCWCRPSGEREGSRGQLGRHREAPRAPCPDITVAEKAPEELDPAPRSAARSRRLPLEGVIDLAAERARLAKEIAEARCGRVEDRRQARQCRFPQARARRGGRGAARAPRGSAGAQGQDGRSAEAPARPTCRCGCGAAPREPSAEREVDQQLDVQRHDDGRDDAGDDRSATAGATSGPILALRAP